jgi:predicted RNA-binding Zn ribbon-like protein
MSDSNEPGARRPAPGGLALVQAFVNTFDIEGERDRAATPDALTAWLRERDLLGEDERATESEHQWALEVREALRALAAGNNGEPVAAATRAVLDTAADRAGLTLRHDVGTVALEPAAGGVGGALGRLLTAVHRAALDGTWPRLKTCREHRCRWLFYDHSKNRSGTWCTMAICGTRAKSRAYRSRRDAAYRPRA